GVSLNVKQSAAASPYSIAIRDALRAVVTGFDQARPHLRVIAGMHAFAKVVERQIDRIAVDLGVRILDPHEATLSRVQLPAADAGRFGSDVEAFGELPLLRGVLHFMSDIASDADQLGRGTS